jgi:hypothetical protein
LPHFEVIDLRPAIVVEPGRIVRQLELKELVVGLERSGRHEKANPPDVVAA